MSETPIPVPVMYWHYADGLEKMVMNDLVLNNSISKKKFQAEGLASVIEEILDVFEDNGYVASANAVDPSDGITYRKWTVTPFFLSRIQAQRDSQAEQDAIKMALWNQKNQLMATAQKDKAAMARAAAATPNMDVNVEETEADIHDRIQPELDALKKMMRGELAEKKRLQRERDDGVVQQQ